MKSSTFLMTFATIAAVSMSSCSQNEELVAPDSHNSDNAVMFGTYIGKNPAARGNIITTDVLKDEKSTGFGVLAYYTGSDDFGTGSTPNFMYNQQVTYDKTNNVWKYSPLKYWPNNDDEKISFFAYAPYTATFGETGIIRLSGNTAAGDPTLTFKMPADVSEHIDLLYADAAATGINQIKDLTKPAANAEVALKFKHALSRIDFKRVVLIDDDAEKKLDENTTITIDKLTFSPLNFGSEGTLNLNTGEWSDVTYTTEKYVFNSSDFSDGSNVLTSANAMTEAPLSVSKGSIMFIPVAQTAPGVTKNGEITIEYTVSTTDTKLDGDKSAITNTRTVPFNIDFKQGNVYTLVLKIGMTSVKLDATVSAWDTTEEQTIEHYCPLKMDGVKN